MNRVLLIDLDTVRRHIPYLRLALAPVLAANLEEGLGLLACQEFDLVLLRPDSDAVQAVRAKTDAGIVVVSPHDDELVNIRLLRTGADDFVRESTLTPTSLRAALVYSLARRRIRQTTSRIHSRLQQLEVT